MSEVDMAATSFKHPCGLSAGDEVWVRAIVTDPCTSGVGVKVVKSPSGYILPGDVRADHVQLRLKHHGLFDTAGTS